MASSSGARRHVLLHRAAKTLGLPFERREDRLGIDLGTLRDPDRAGFVDAPLSLAHQVGSE